VGTADKVVDLLARHLGEVHEDQEYVDYAAAGACLTVGSHAWAAYHWHALGTPASSMDEHS
jgi:hypothetical protein